MNTLAFIASGCALVAFGWLCVATANAVYTYRANRKSEAAALTKRQHDAVVAKFLTAFNEAAILFGRKK